MEEVKNRWDPLSNPFFNRDSSVITGHVSGRARDVRNIVMGEQSALIITGAAKIGKTALIHYLKRQPSAEWSWRDELRGLLPRADMDNIHFTIVDLTPIEEGKSPTEQLTLFIRQCLLALERVIYGQVPTYASVEGVLADEETTPSLVTLKRRLRQCLRQDPAGRYFVILDAINRLGQAEHTSNTTNIQTPQDQGLALLDQCGAFRVLVDFLDQFRNFGVILSIESLPCPNIEHQFGHISPYLSAVLASFNTMPLQIFTWREATAFLAQTPSDFGKAWAQLFPGDSQQPLFTEEEQTWIRRQAGTHPYLLHQFCFYAFQFKQEYATQQDSWLPLPENCHEALLQCVNQRVNLFLTNIWYRLQEAVDKCGAETRTNLYLFLGSLTQKHSDMEIETSTWERLDKEVQYILYSEGLVRYNLSASLRAIYYPGSLLAEYLAQKVGESSTPASRSLQLTITRPDAESEQVLLSDLEYRLIKTLLQHPKRSTEEELMKSAWGKVIDRQTFTQRMYQLRKKLKGASADNDIITNHYGGQYSLLHAEWLYLE